MISWTQRKQLVVFLNNKTYSGKLGSWHLAIGAIDQCMAGGKYAHMAVGGTFIQQLLVNPSI